MAAKGLPVPRFFCLSAEAFQEALAPHAKELRSRIRELDHAAPATLTEQASRLQDLVRGLAMPPSLEKALLAAFDEELGARTVVSVRSCSLARVAGEGEDSSTDAFAGISASYLYVSRGDLLRRVKDCWASAFSPEALLYHHARGSDPLDCAVAVGVQRMVAGHRSFVLFTCDPTTGARDPVIAAGLGIGEGIVQEKVPVDHYFVDRSDGTVSSHIAHKTQRMGQDPDDPEAGTTLLPVPEAEADRPALDEDMVRALLQHGGRIEELFGAPQDIEGTITSDGGVHILQARPVVVDWSRQRLWSNANITESYPGVTTALTYSFAQRFYKEIFSDFYRRLGVPARARDRQQDALEGMIGFQRGRIYYALTAWYRLHRQSPLFPAWRPHWERMMGLEDTAPDAHRDRLRPGAAGSPMLLAAGAQAAALTVTHAQAASRFERWWQGALTRSRAALAHGDPLVQAQALRTLWREVAAHWGVTLVNDVLLTTTAGLNSSLLDRWLPHPEAGLLSGLLCGDEENRSVTILMSTVSLAEQVRADSRLMEDLRQQPADSVWDQLEKGVYGAELLRNVREHLDKHGDRGLQELKLEVPNPRQRPEQLLRMVGEYARADITVADLRAREQDTRDQAEKRLDVLLAGQPGKRRLLRALLAAQRRYIKFREDSRYCRSELFGFAKELFLSLGQDLAARGALDEQQDIVHLTQEEVLGYFDGTGTTDDLRGLAAVRRAEYEQREDAELPMHFATLGPVRDTLPAARAPQDDSATLVGLGSSGGTVRGTARVVLDPHEPVEAADDMILIARETDPGWMFLMLSARGIVVERGTMLSHTAITGRKFGIPTVVSVPHATRRIPDGARIEINGATGTVTLLEDGRP